MNNGIYATPLRVQCLEEAVRLTTGDRNKDYGDPVENMQHIADIFNAITGRDLTAREVAILHQATKISRRQHSACHRDSYVDDMAYTGIELECAMAEAEAHHSTAEEKEELELEAALLEWEEMTREKREEIKKQNLWNRNKYPPFGAPDVAVYGDGLPRSQAYVDSTGTLR